MGLNAGDSFRAAERGTRAGLAVVYSLVLKLTQDWVAMRFSTSADHWQSVIVWKWGFALLFGGLEKVFQGPPGEILGLHSRNSWIPSSYLLPGIDFYSYSNHGSHGLQIFILPQWNLLFSTLHFLQTMFSGSLSSKWSAYLHSLKTQNVFLDPFTVQCSWTSPSFLMDTVWSLDDLFQREALE